MAHLNTPLIRSQLAVERPLCAFVDNAGMTPHHRQQMGQRLEAAAERAGKDQKWVADRLGCTVQHVSKLYKTGSISLDMLVELCLALGLSLDFIVWGSGTRLPIADPKFVDQLRALTDVLSKPPK